MEESARIIEEIRKALRLIEMYTKKPITPETGAMSHAQLGEFKQVLMNMEGNLIEPSSYKERVLNDPYKSWMSQTIAKSWPSNDLGAQVMKAEQSYLKLREILKG